MAKWTAILVGLLLLLASNYAIHDREQLLENGRIVRLELAPVDPRSLMQGDYMALRFKVADEAFGRGRLQAEAGQPQDGRLRLKLDERGVGHFASLDDSTAPGADELPMRYRVRAGQVKFGTNAFFFQEGHADRYAGARYGEFRVAPNGDAILTGLLGPELQALDNPPGPPGR